MSHDKQSWLDYSTFDKPVFFFVYSVVKEEIVDDEARLPCFNGRVISWVWLFLLNVLHSFNQLYLFM